MSLSRVYKCSFSFDLKRATLFYADLLQPFCLRSINTCQDMRRKCLKMRFTYGVKLYLHLGTLLISQLNLLRNMHLSLRIRFLPCCAVPALGFISYTLPSLTKPGSILMKYSTMHWSILKSCGSLSLINHQL